MDETENVKFLMSLDPDAQSIRKAVDEANKIIKEESKGKGGKGGGGIVGSLFGGFSEESGAFFGAVGGVAGGVAAGIGAGITAVQKFADTVKQFVGIASPATLERFNNALDDVYGVIGQSLIPVLDVMTDAVRIFGDVLANLLPNVNESREALEPLREALREMGKAIRDFAAEVGPLVRDVLITALQALAETLKGLAEVTTYVFRQWKEQFGSLTTSVGQGRTALGAAAKPASFSSFEEYQKQAQLSAFSQGATKNDIPNQQLSSLKVIESNSIAMNSTLEALLNFFTGGLYNGIKGSAAAINTVTQEGEEGESLRRSMSSDLAGFATAGLSKLVF